MNLKERAVQIIETDVLVIGGGIAGSFAAIKAKGENAKVVVFEKAAVERSGGASGGPLHWHGVRAPSLGIKGKEMIDTLDKAGGRGFVKGPQVLEGLIDKNFNAIMMKEAWDCICDLENWGVNMKWDNGEYYFLPDPVTGAMTELRFHGNGLKKKLFEQMRRSHIEIYERTMVIDLLTQNGGVVGATAFNIRTGDFIVCKAKAVIMATGWPTRTHHPIQGPTTGMYKMIFNVPDSGDGLAIAFRAGAELVNMEIPRRDRALMWEHDAFIGKIGAINQIQPGIPIVNAKGEKIAVTSLRLSDQLKEEEAGRGPCYLDTTNLPEEAYQYIETARGDEFPIASRMYKMRELDLRTHKFEMSDYKPYFFSVYSGVLIDSDTRTRVKGLYAAGGNAGAGAQTGAMSGAAVFGAIAGKNAAKFISSIGELKIDEGQVEEQKKSIFTPILRKEGVPPLELEMKLRDILERYAGIFRSEGRLNQGIWRLNSARDKFFPEMIAKTPHELMSAQEVRNLFLIGEVHLLSAKERKESGMGFYRQDYPEKMNDPWKKSIIIWKEGSEIKIGHRKMPELKNELK